MSVAGYIPAQQVACSPSMWSVVRRKFAGGRSFWALADQVLISATNFLTMILVARGLSKYAFGEFSLVYSGLLFANLLQTGLITQPHNVLGATRFGWARRDYVRYTASTAFSQLMLAGLEVFAAASLAAIAFAWHWNSAALLLSLVPAIVAWQLQEFVRRVLYSEGRTGAALFNDVISYGLQTLLIAWFWHDSRLTAPLAIYILALTSGAAAAVGLLQIYPSLASRVDRAVFRENWEFGKWLLGSEVLNWCASLSAYMYIAGIMLGATAGGELRAVQILFGPARVFSYFLCTILPIQFAQALAGGGNVALRRQLWRVSRYVIILMAIYCAAVAFFARPLLTLAYSREYAGSAPILVMYSAVSYLSYIQMLFIAALMAQRRTREVFLGSLCGALITAVISWALIHTLQLPGALMGMIATQVAVTFVLVYSFLRRRPELQTDAGVYSTDRASSRASHSAIESSNSSDNEEVLDDQQSEAGEILARVFEVMEQAGVPWCVLHGYENYPHRIDSDVDLLVGEDWLADRLVKLLIAQQDQIGAKVVQWFNDGAQFIVLAAKRADGSACLLQLHVTSRYTLCNRIFASGSEILASRRKRNGTWVPSAELEFICVLANRICKRNLTAKHARRLSELYRSEPAGCDEQLERLFDAEHQARLLEAAQSNLWAPIQEQIDELRRQLLTNRGLQRTGESLSAFTRRIRRWLRPRCGLHVVFLGPDGVGKSTVIEAFTRDLRGAFLRTTYLTFAPSLLPARLAAPKPGGPHSLPPRSWPASLVKACWWLVCYTLGYYASVYPTLARAGMVVNHRYLLDAMTDRRRYRYSGPRWLLKFIWRIVPKPDLVLLLDAPPEVIRSRKSELPLERIVELRDGYRRAVGRLANGRIIDASQPLAKVVAQAEAIVVEHLASRVKERAGVGATSASVPAKTDAPPQQVSGKEFPRAVSPQRVGTPFPSPDNPGEGQGEGLPRERLNSKQNPGSESPHPIPLPAYRERGQCAFTTARAVTDEFSVAATPPPALTWVHLLPANSSLKLQEHHVARATSPCASKQSHGLVAHATKKVGRLCGVDIEWFSKEVAKLKDRGELSVRVAFEEIDPQLNADEAGLIAINCSRVSLRRFEQAGLKYVRRFAALPTLRHARWFVPLDSPAVASAGLSLYTPARTMARVKRAAVRFATHLRIPAWYRDEVIVALREPPPLERTIASIFGDDIRLALSAGAPEGALNRKASALAIAPSGKLLGFIKLARSPVARAIARNEACALRGLTHLSVPRLLYYGNVDGTDVLVQTALPGKPAPLAFGPAHRAFLASLQTGQRAPASQTRMVVELRGRIAALGFAGEQLGQTLDDLEPILSTLTVPITIVHGDFAPWNLRLHEGRVSAFDWEYAQHSGLPLIDEIHYRLQVGLLIDDWSVERAAAELERLGKSAPLGLNGEQFRAIAIVYLLDALARLLGEGYEPQHSMIAWHRSLLERIWQRVTPAVPQMATA